MTRVVVTGAGRGIGHALATGYLNRGWEVWAGCRSPERAPGLADRGALMRRLDVTDEETIKTFAAAVASAGEVNLLINAAGIDARTLGAAPGRRGPFEIDPEHFLGEMRVNAAGPMLVTRALLPQLTHGGTAKVVNLSSRLASMTIGAELCWDIGYNASKAALNAVTVRTAKLLARPASSSSPSTPAGSAPPWAARKPSSAPRKQPASSSRPSRRSITSTPECS